MAAAAAGLRIILLVAMATLMEEEEEEAAYPVIQPKIVPVMAALEADIRKKRLPLRLALTTILLVPPELRARQELVPAPLQAAREAREESPSTSTPPPRFLPQPARASRSRARLPTPHPPPQWPSPTPRPPTSPTSSSRPGAREEVVAVVEELQLLGRPVELAILPVLVLTHRMHVLLRR